MKVKELIERLSKMPENCEVLLSDKRNFTIASSRNVEVQVIEERLEGNPPVLTEFCVISGDGPDLYPSNLI